MEKNDLDFLILDGEVMPWRLKGSTLIENEFYRPGICALYSREKAYGKESQPYKNVENYLKILSWFTGFEEPKYRVFDVLSRGKCNLENKTYNSIEFENYEEKQQFIQAMADHHFIFPVEYHIIDLTKEEEYLKYYEMWENYCENGGEGWVSIFLQSPKT